MKKHLMNYIADKGSVVVNGVCFSNGHGDGMFGVYFTPEKPKYSNIWIDLRETPKIEIWEYDCIMEHKGETKPRVQTFTSADFENAQAIDLQIDSKGNLIISKYF